jgi:hypothetical protein
MPPFDHCELQRLADKRLLQPTSVKLSPSTPSAGEELQRAETILRNITSTHTLQPIDSEKSLDEVENPNQGSLAPAGSDTQILQPACADQSSQMRPEEANGETCHNNSTVNSQNLVETTDFMNKELMFCHSLGVRLLKVRPIPIQLQTLPKLGNTVDRDEPNSVQEETLLELKKLAGAVAAAQEKLGLVLKAAKNQPEMRQGVAQAQKKQQQCRHRKQLTRPLPVVRTH